MEESRIGGAKSAQTNLTPKSSVSDQIKELATAVASTATGETSGNIDVKGVSKSLFQTGFIDKEDHALRIELLKKGIEEIKEKEKKCSFLLDKNKLIKELKSDKPLQRDAEKLWKIYIKQLEESEKPEDKELDSWQDLEVNVDDEKKTAASSFVDAKGSFNESSLIGFLKKAEVKEEGKHNLFDQLLNKLSSADLKDLSFSQVHRAFNEVFDEIEEKRDEVEKLIAEFEENLVDEDKIYKDVDLECGAVVSKELISKFLTNEITSRDVILTEVIKKMDEDKIYQGKLGYYLHGKGGVDEESFKNAIREDLEKFLDGIESMRPPTYTEQTVGALTTTASGAWWLLSSAPYAVAGSVGSVYNFSATVLTNATEEKTTTQSVGRLAGQAAAAGTILAYPGTVFGTYTALAVKLAALVAGGGVLGIAAGVAGGVAAVYYAVPAAKMGLDVAGKTGVVFTNVLTGNLFKAESEEAGKEANKLLNEGKTFNDLVEKGVLAKVEDKESSNVLTTKTLSPARFFALSLFRFTIANSGKKPEEMQEALQAFCELTVYQAGDQRVKTTEQELESFKNWLEEISENERIKKMVNTLVETFISKQEGILKSEIDAIMIALGLEEITEEMFPEVPERKEGIGLNIENLTAKQFQEYVDLIWMKNQNVPITKVQEANLERYKTLMEKQQKPSASAHAGVQKDAQKTDRLEIIAVRNEEGEEQEEG